MNTNKKIIVTGGYGFIGSHMVRRLVEQGESVVVFVRAGSNGERLRDVASKIEVVEEDLLDKERLALRIKEIDPKGVYHFAASNIQSGVISSNEDVLLTNIGGVSNLLDALAPLPYDFFINIGSFLEYGMKDHPLVESDLPEPPNTYAVSKLGGTLLLHTAGLSGKPTTTLRLMTPYGPQIQQGRLMYELVKNALANSPIKLTRPTVGRDFLYVDDIVDLCLEAAAKASEHKGEIFNMGSGVQTNLGPLAEMVLQKTASQSQVEWGSFKQVAYDSDIWVADMSKTFSHFAWRPKVSLEQGVDKMIEWCKNN